MKAKKISLNGNATLSLFFVINNWENPKKNSVKKF